MRNARPGPFARGEVSVEASSIFPRWPAASCSAQQPPCSPLPVPASLRREAAASASAGPARAARIGAAAFASGAAWPRPRPPVLAVGAVTGTLARHGGPPNVLHAPHLCWGARTHVVRARPLDACGIAALLAALSPHQFAFIRDNVFVPPQLQHLHARLWARAQPRATPLRPLLAGLTRGGRTDKLSYLFAFFHLSAGSHAGADDGAWCSVASPRDARTLARLAEVLAPNTATANDRCAAVPAVPAA